MLEQITWTQYGGAVGAGLVAYYLYVWWRYGKQKAVRRPVSADDAGASYDEEGYPEGDMAYAGTDAGDGGYGDDAGPDDADFEQAAQLMEAIRSVIRTAGVNATGKAELCAELRGLLVGYPGLKVPAFRPGINYQIMTELKDTGSVTLSEREVDGLW